VFFVLIRYSLLQLKEMATERPPAPGIPKFSLEEYERLPLSVDQVKTDIQKEESEDSISITLRPMDVQSLITSIG